MSFTEDNIISEGLIFVREKGIRVIHKNISPEVEAARTRKVKRAGSVKFFVPVTTHRDARMNDATFSR